MTPVPPMAQRPSESMPGVLPSGCRADGARSTWILGTAFGTSGVAGNTSIERFWCGADGARKRARCCAQAALQAASCAASAPSALQRASSPTSRSILSSTAGSEDAEVRSCRTNSTAHASTVPARRTMAAAHLHGLRLIALGASEKPAELLARLFLVGGGPGTREALRARVCRNKRSQIGELFGLQCEELVAGLYRLQTPHSGLARGDECIGLAARGVEVLHDTRLDPERILIRGQRVLPALLRIADELLRGGRAGVALRVETLEGLIDLVDVVGQALRLVEQLLRACERLLDGLQARIGQARQVLRLIEQHLRLVLQAGDLVVDLLQGAGGLQHVLGVVRGVINDHLRARWCADGDEGKARGADQDHVLNEAMV